MKSYIDITFDENDTRQPIKPIEDFLFVPINITYWFTWGILGRFINHIFKGKRIDIKCEIFNIPEWCTAYAPFDYISWTITSQPNIKLIENITVAFSVSEDAPAYLPFTLNFKATMDEKILGPLGFITLLSSVTKTVNITLKSDYLALINLSLPEGHEIETPPLIEKQLPIKCTNLGNGRTRIKCEIITSPPGFLIYFDPYQLILNVGEERITNIKITAPSNFSGLETIQLGFTPQLAENPEIEGETIFITIIVFYNPP